MFMKIIMRLSLKKKLVLLAMAFLVSYRIIKKQEIWTGRFEGFECIIEEYSRGRLVPFWKSDFMFLG